MISKVPNWTETYTSTITSLLEKNEKQDYLEPQKIIDNGILYLFVGNAVSIFWQRALGTYL